MNKRKEEFFESVPKWADLYEVSHDTVKMRSCAGPFSSLTNSHMILGPRCSGHVLQNVQLTRCILGLFSLGLLVVSGSSDEQFAHFESGGL